MNRDYRGAVDWARKFGLTDKFPPEQLVSQMIQSGENEQAAYWAKKWNLR